LADYLPWCETVIINTVPAHPVCRDPDDDKFLALAIAANADALITGDGDLLSLASQVSIAIVRPADFIAAYSTG